MDSSNDEALDIIVTNVVATFRTRCHLNLRTIALEGSNVIYKPEVGVRKPNFIIKACAHLKNGKQDLFQQPPFLFSESSDEAS